MKSKEGLKELYRRYSEVFNYFLFGVGTTVISFGTYYLVRWIFPDRDSVPSWLGWIFSITSRFGIESNTALPVIISWFFSVLFAFLTNRIYVFHSKADTAWAFIKEMLAFYGTRLMTLVMDMVIMFLLVDLTGIENALYEFACKVFSNVLVLIVNFVLSKLFIFRDNKKSKKAE
ncbi:MAG: GtrA family protein [Oscillospiraceae bacterium]